MPLSEHEQRMLEQIESALYAEDPKFASQVRTASTQGPSTRRRFQFAALFGLGLVLLIAGVALPVSLGGFPIVSFVGFLVMFSTGVWALLGNHGRGGSAEDAESPADGTAPKNGPGSSKGGRPKSAPKRNPKGSSGSFSKRMEERFRKRFEQ
ncbi:DUF3040 domain-containing protein [Hoyosella rhizosphaerae]|uniref:DUF3040 domain-containing protein n=1 Tax=Hoyosella rhizosphaerae TaxID=1755582 RepID=A0A916UHD9_9ACTN|nr:DUF3040 domain-containing protein [Hoyosella rhizosphaerae]MBN4927923.1 DUF3040 domain-containing protein [Hoyosella rhizosphaerae]GGC71027.1 hypothetical protein GCM10011410_24910 [Hoyosella rhizosphaerae]